jgi:hypothetical protein
MAVLDEFLKRSNADGKIYPVQYYDTSTLDMEVVATDKPLPVDIKNADIEVNVNVSDIVSVEQSDKTKLKGTMAIDQTTDGTTNKVQAKNAARGDFQTNATLQIGATDVSNAVPVPVSDAGGILTVDGSVIAAISQVTDGTTNKVQARNVLHDDFQVNANVQVGNTDISDSIPLPIKLIPTIGSVSILYNAITATPTSATPTEVVLGNSGNIKIEISGTASARTITFAAKLTATSDEVSIDGYNWSTHTLAISTTGTSTELWEFDGLTGFYSLVIKPTVITGGNLTIKTIKVVA